VTFALARISRLDLESFARAANVHPEFVRRLVALGLLAPVADAGGEPWFSPTEVAAVGRLQRLRAGLSLNYAALGVVVDLLERIAELEAALRQRQPVTGGPPWT
jgi:chaperone modulatory protein CbpM